MSADRTARELGLFPGQGSQRPGMAAWITRHPAAKEVFRRADELLDLPLTALCVEGSAEELRATDITQPAVVATSLALVAVRRERGELPDAVAGHSLGEFTALAVAGVLDADAVLTLVRLRGRLMAEAARRSGGAMAAIIGLPSEQVEALCARARSGIVVVANQNQPTQTVVSGEVAAVAEVAEAARAAGAAKVVRLPVGGAFHSPLMADAAAEFATELARHPLHPPLLPVLSPATAGYLRDPAATAAALRGQLLAPVRWVDTIRRAVADGYTTLTELGPGTVLTACSRRIAPDAVATAVSEP